MQALMHIITVRPAKMSTHVEATLCNALFQVTFSNSLGGSIRRRLHRVRSFVGPKNVLNGDYQTSISGQ